MTESRTKPLSFGVMCRIHWPWLLGSVLLVVTSLWTASLWKQNRAVLSVLQQDRAAVVAVGAFMGHLSGISADGTRAAYALDNRNSGSLVLTLSFDCGFCAQNKAVWERLSGVASAHGVQTVWLSRDPFDRVASVESPPQPLVVEPSHRTYQAAALSSVPQTIVLDKDGVVIGVHTGLIDTTLELKFIERIVGVADVRSNRAFVPKQGQERR